MRLRAAAVEWPLFFFHRTVAFRVVVLLTLALTTRTAGADFYVAPRGSDAAAGTREQPFATLNRARDAARGVPADQSRRIVVRGGRYFNVSLALGPEDSGLVIKAAPGEEPVFYGGQPITGWEKDGEHFYAARLPEFPAVPENVSAGLPARQWEVRLLEVNGTLAPRARFPEQGTRVHLTSFDVPWMSSTGGGWKRPPTRDELTTLKYQPGDLPANLEVKNAEVTVYHMWDESCVGVAAHDPAQQTLTLAPPCGHPPGAFGVKKFVVWNTREGLTQPGQWYHDRARGRLVYWPLPGQDMSKAEVIAPTVSTILRLKGRADAKVKNITVRGLSFAVTTVPLIAGGFAAGAFDGAIFLEHTEGCAFRDLTVTASRVMRSAPGATSVTRSSKAARLPSAARAASTLAARARRSTTTTSTASAVFIRAPSASTTADAIASSATTRSTIAPTRRSTTAACGTSSRTTCSTTA